MFLNTRACEALESIAKSLKEVVGAQKELREEQKKMATEIPKQQKPEEIFEMVQKMLLKISKPAGGNNNELRK